MKTAAEMDREEALLKKVRPKYHKAVSLFGWREEDGMYETNKLILLFVVHGWTIMCYFSGAIYLVSPHKHQYRIFYLSDNGGEINVGFEGGESASIPSTCWHSNLNAETMRYRIQCWLDKEPIDYMKKCDPLTEEELQLLIHA